MVLRDTPNIFASSGDDKSFLPDCRMLINFTMRSVLFRLLILICLIVAYAVDGFLKCFRLPSAHRSVFQPVGIFAPFYEITLVRLFSFFIIIGDSWRAPVNKCYFDYSPWVGELPLL